MANKANLELQFLNLQNVDEVIIKKFFLVQFIDPRSRGTNLRSYLCIIWRYNKLYLNGRTTILLKLTDKVNSSLTDVRHFFGENFVLQQFWPKFRALKSIQDFAGSYKSQKCKNPNLASSIVYQCYRDEKLDSNFVFYTSKDQEEYHHIVFPVKNVLNYYNEKKKELIIFPNDFQLENILGDPELSQLEPTHLPCFALWITWSEEMEVKSYKSFFYDITYDIEISNDLKNGEDSFVKVSQFDSYFFLPSAYELDSQACNYPSQIKYVNEDFELERSYSQKKLEYFDEWEKLGIKSRAAFRTHTSTKFVDYFRNRFIYLKFSFTVVDKDSRLNASLNLTIATLIITILWELGHDKINYITVFQELKYINPDAFWLIMNSLMFFGTVRVFFFKNWFTKGSSAFDYVISMGIIAYFSYYFLFLILNIFLRQPISIIWLNELSKFLFQKYIIIHVIGVGLISFVVKKTLFKLLHH